MLLPASSLGLYIIIKILLFIPRPFLSKEAGATGNNSSEQADALWGGCVWKMSCSRPSALTRLTRQKRLRQPFHLEVIGTSPGEGFENCIHSAGGIAFQYSD